MKAIFCVLPAAAAALALNVAPASANGGECFDKGTGQYVQCPGYVNWTGLYAGGHLGYGAGEMDAEYSNFVIAAPDSQFDLGGLVGGIQLGAQYHFSNNLVLGIEGDVSKMYAEEDDFFSPGGGVTITEDAEIETLASLRVRAGYAVGEFMPYVTGGLAAAAWNYEVADSNFPRAFEYNETALGAVAGGGFEWMVLEDVSVGAEGLYYFIDDTESFVIPLAPATGGTVSIDDIFVGRVRVNFLF